MRKITLPLALVTLSAVFAASKLLAAPAAKPALNLPTVNAPSALPSAQISSMTALLRAQANAKAAKLGQPMPLSAQTVPTSWQSPVVLTPAAPSDNATGSYLSFQNATYVTPKSSPGNHPAAYLKLIGDFAEDRTSHTWSLLGPLESGVEIVLSQLLPNHLYSIDCQVGTPQGTPISMVIYNDEHSTSSVSNGHVVTAFVAREGGAVKMGIAATGWPNALSVAPAWTFNGCTFTAI